MGVTDVLRDRLQEPAGLDRMIAFSIAVHAVFAAILLAAPGGWLRSAPETPKTVMTISLGGAGEGPQNGGMTAMGGRAIQVQKTPDETPQRQAVRTAGAK